MASVSGNTLVARSLHQQGIEKFFFIMGGPMGGVEGACVDEGMRAIDVRHEQAAAMMAHAYARVLNRPSVCMAASGPGTLNLATGVGNAFVDCAPIVALGGTAAWGSWGRGAFQEMDQVSVFRPITKWAERVYHTRRIPELVATAFRQSRAGKPGPVYLDLPGDVLYQEVDEGTVEPVPASPGLPGRPQADPSLVKAALKRLSESRRPILLIGSGALWSGAAEDLRTFVDVTGIPFYTTPQARGLVPDDHPLSFLTARSGAFREADCLLVVGTRFNYMLGYGKAPRFTADCSVIQIDVDAAEMGHNRAVDIGIVADARAALSQLLAGAESVLAPRLYAEWVDKLRRVDARKRQEAEVAISTDQVPIHPLRLCKEVRDFLDRDAILAVDGQEILNFGRQVIPTFVPGHRLNSGPAGTMGVGLPFGLGARVAKPDKQVLVLHGDGSFGLNAMELDTAVRHKLPVVTVISNNGGWTGDPDGIKVGRNLGYPRYDRMAEGLGCHGEFVESPEDIRPALERAFASGLPAVVNVITDYRVQAVTQKFTDYAGSAA